MAAISPHIHEHMPAPTGGAAPLGSGSVRPEPGETFAPLLDRMPGAVLQLDPVGRIVHINGIAELRLDIVRGDAMGRDLFRELFPQLEVDGAGPRYRAAMLAGEAALACNLTVERSTGPVHLSLGIRSFLHHGVLGSLVLVEDRSALLGEEERRHRAEHLAAVGELATGVAHEINNPLASIKGFAQLLSRDAATESEIQALDIISQECSRVAKIIDRLLTFAEQQRVRSTGSVDLSALVDGVLDLRQYALETAGIEVQRDLDPSVAHVRGDRGALQRMVLALIRYAERSLLAQEPDRRLSVCTRESSDGVVLYVVDNGVGIPRERLRTLFSTIDAEDTLDGMGLAGAMEVAREHGGQLWADSVAGDGTAFVVRLPAVEERIPAPPPPPPPQVLTANLRSVPTRPLRVLVADDESTLRLAIGLFLGRHGHEVVQAADAIEAQQLALEGHFDVVLADARMPGDGVALLEELEKLAHFKGRTILMTGDLTHPYAAEAVRTGRPYLIKPFDMTEVIRLIEAVGR